LDSTSVNYYFYQESLSGSPIIKDSAIGSAEVSAWKSMQKDFIRKQWESTFSTKGMFDTKKFLLPIPKLEMPPSLEEYVTAKAKAKADEEVDQGTGDVKETGYSQQLVDFIKDYEEVELEAYNNGQTIGWGHDYQEGEERFSEITIEQAIEYLNDDLGTAYQRVVAKQESLADLGYNVDFTCFSQDEVNMLVDFSFNRGQGLADEDPATNLTSLAGLVVAISNNDDDKVYEILMREIYNTKDEEYLGLERRRLDEYEMYLIGDYKRTDDVGRDIK